MWNETYYGDGCAVKCRLFPVIFFFFYRRVMCARRPNENIILVREKRECSIVFPDRAVTGRSDVAPGEKSRDNELSPSIDFVQLCEPLEGMKRKIFARE